MKPCGVVNTQVLKTLLAKIMSSNFHKTAHFDKIQDALNKVRFRVVQCCCTTHVFWQHQSTTFTQPNDAGLHVGHWAAFLSLFSCSISLSLSLRLALYLSVYIARAPPNPTLSPYALGASTPNLHVAAPIALRLTSQAE